MSLEFYFLMPYSFVIKFNLFADTFEQLTNDSNHCSNEETLLTELIVCGHYGITIAAASSTDSIDIDCWGYVVIGIMLP